MRYQSKLKLGSSKSEYHLSANACTDPCILFSRFPVPLSETYVQWDHNFSYRHIETCEIDREVWGDIEPRQSYSMWRSGQFYCIVCDKPQSDDPKLRECQCFPEIFGGSPTPFPVQVFQTVDGRNNGLLACGVSLPFPFLLCCSHMHQDVLYLQARFRP